MINLIKNSEWKPGPQGGPMYFSGTGPVTYDDFYYNGNRSCSVTIPACGETSASDMYDLPINVRSHSTIIWGYYIRAIQTGEIILRADFFDGRGMMIETSEQEVSDKVCENFHKVYACFEIPKNACTVKLSMHFYDTITACTFCAPFAYFIGC